MNRQTVVQLRQTAKERGLRGYSKLRKAELIELISESILKEVEEVDREEVVRERAERERVELITKIDKTVDDVKKEAEGWGQWMKNKLTSPIAMVNDNIKAIKDGVNKLYQENVKPAFSFFKNTWSQWMKKNDEPMIRDDKVKESDQHIFEMVESKSSLKQFAKQYTIDGVESYSVLAFFQAVKPIVVNFLSSQKNIKIEFVLRCNMSKTSLLTGKSIIKPAFFNSFIEIIFEDTDIEEIYEKSVDKMIESLTKYTKEGSGWKIHSVEGLDLHTVKYTPLNGSSYIKLPYNLVTKKAIINMKNEDDECFKWCVTRALNPVVDHAERVSEILRVQAKKLNWTGLKFPLAVKDISRFEILNPGLAVNVYMYEKQIKPLRVSNVDSNKPRIHLLLISAGEKQHYCLIKNLSRLVSSDLSKKEHKKFICERCLNYFGSQKVLDTHSELCKEHEAVREKLPEAGTVLSFKNTHKKMDMPFVRYADFESVIKPLHTVQPNPNESYTEKKEKHIPVSFCYFIKCSFDDKHSKLVHYTAKSEDEDVAQTFVNMLEEEVKRIYKDYPSKKMIFTNEDLEVFQNATTCWICQKAFTFGEEDGKVRDHCHYTGKFRGAAHNSCNIKFRRPNFTPVVFHNLSNYDAHLFVKNLGISEGPIDCIPNNNEKYISFTKTIEVDKFFVKRNETKRNTIPQLRQIAKERGLRGYSKLPKAELIEFINQSTVEERVEGQTQNVVDKEVVVKRELRFIDSFKFMGSSVAKHVENLVKKNDSFENTKRYFDEEKLTLLKRKGVYPYEWLDSIDRLNETELPPIETFFSTLNGGGISEEDYEHAQNVWKTFGMKTMRDYHDLYNTSDVLLLCDIFENFRKVCKENYDLDPCWYYTAPGLAWDACLKLTGIKLELLSDPNMLHMFEKGIRGGISMIPTRHSKANNKYMGEKFDPSEPSKFITYVDANNLYGWAMSKLLPTHGFKWVDEKDFDDWKNFPCILEVDLKVPETLKDYFNDYPLAPENLPINKVKKLLCTLYDKKKYVIHHETLKLYESLGIEIEKIHRIIGFEESAWMKPYIDLNTELRTKADNDFEKDFFKLMNNSVYGKTMENIRNRVDIRLINSEEKGKKLAKKPNFKHCTIFSENLCAIEMRKTDVYFNKPIYLGMCILDLSKTLMYDFHYNYIKSKYSDKAKLLFTDTDSLCYEIQTEDFYKDISNDVDCLFDTSNIPKDHSSGIRSGVNEKIPGMFKDEAGGKIIEEFVGLRAKLYSYRMFESRKETKTCKGVKKNVVKNTISFDDYKKCLFSGEQQYRKMNTLRSRKHDIFMEEINKVALSANDDKRVILSDRVNTHAPGYYFE